MTVEELIVVALRCGLGFKDLAYFSVGDLIDFTNAYVEFTSEKTEQKDTRGNAESLMNIFNN